MDFSRPTNKVVTFPGKTTTSLKAKNGKSYSLKYHAEYETTGIFRVGKSGEEPQDLHMTKPF